MLFGQKELNLSLRLAVNSGRVAVCEVRRPSISLQRLGSGSESCMKSQSHLPESQHTQLSRFTLGLAAPSLLKPHVSLLGWIDVSQAQAAGLPFSCAFLGFPHENLVQPGPSNALCTTSVVEGVWMVSSRCFAKERRVW